MLKFQVLEVRVMRVLGLALVLSLLGCSEESSSPADSTTTDAATADQPAITDQLVADADGGFEASTSFSLLSSSITQGQPIDAKHTCDGADASPDLSWAGAPAGTLSYVLIVDDPDAPGGTFTHWVAYDIEGSLNALSEGLATTSSVPGVCRQGKNSFDEVGYRGPCPPSSSTHHYYFRLAALSVSSLSIAADPDRAAVEQAMQGNVLGQAELMGTYSR
jgi:Raf kinase inhibitor-like YbhB/YbcL family protein